MVFIRHKSVIKTYVHRAIVLRSVEFTTMNLDKARLHEPRIARSVKNISLTFKIIVLPLLYYMAIDCTVKY